MLAELLANRTGDPSEFHFGATSLRSDELLERSLRLAQALKERGACATTRLAAVLPNGLELVTTIVAATAIPAPLLLINPSYRREEIAFALVRAAAGIVLTTDEKVRDVREAAAQANLPQTIISGSTSTGADAAFQALLGGAPAALGPRRSEDPAVFLMSSGTTGRPKLVPRSHGQLAAEAESLCATEGANPGDAVLCAVPLFHGYGFGNCLLTALRSGAALVCPERVQPVQLHGAALLEEVVRRKVTILPGTPYLFETLCALSAAGDLSRVRLGISAGLPLRRDVFDAFAGRFGLSIRQHYGTSESGALTLNLDTDVSASAHTVGRPLRGVEIRVDGPAGEPGEVAVRSAGVTAGYLDLPDVNRTVFVDGWFKTGDLGSLDEAGRLQLTGRRRMYVDIFGNKVDPFEVEDVILQIPGVKEVAVVGVTRPLGHGALLKAVIVPATGLEAKEVQKFCARRLANFKVPEVIEFRDGLPKSPLGKILRKDLL